jgi:hypothetical protein
MLTNRFTLLALPLSVASLVMAACGGSADDPSASTGSSQAEMREAALDYAKCMRQHGVDMPDPQFNGKGMTMQLGGPGQGKPPKATMDAAQEACQKIMERVKPPTMSKEDQTKAREAALKMARCMREKGFDFPDPQFGEGGQIRQRVGGPGSGLDPSNPRFREAMTDCSKSAGMPGGGPRFQSAG